MNDSVLSALKVCHRFDQNSVPIIDNFNLEVHAGEKVALIGRSGSGKTTLLHLLSGLKHSQSGTICINQRAHDSLSDKARAHLRCHAIGFVYQTFNLMQDFSAIENIALAAVVAGLSHQKAQVKAKQIMQQLNIEHLALRNTNSLSGGEKQRVAIGRAIINQPDILFADEPTGNLDRDSADQVMQTLTQCQRISNMALIMATHDHALVKHFDKIIDLHDVT